MKCCRSREQSNCVEVDPVKEETGDQQRPELLQIKMEVEEQWFNQDEKQLTVKREDEKKPRLSDLHFIGTENSRETEAPTSSSAVQMKTEPDGEDCGRPELDRETNTYLKPNSKEKCSDYFENEVSDEREDDNLSGSGSEKEDSDEDWRDPRTHQSGVNRKVGHQTAISAHFKHHHHSFYMEEILINGVANHPELYDTSCTLYRDRNQKDLAWRRISEEIGQPEYFCRKKWKSLRDTYTKEKRKNNERRNGSAAGVGTKWRFATVMRFLDPFITARETSSDVGGVDVQTAENILPEDQGQPVEAAKPTDSEGVEPSIAASPGSPVPGPSTPAATPTGPQWRSAPRRTRPRTRYQDGLLDLKLAILASLKRPRLSATEHFLLGLVPALESMPPQTREFVKFQCQKVFENTTTVSNLEPLDPSNK